MLIVRRLFLFLTLAAGLFSATGPSAQQGQSYPPIVFVHGNGGNAAVWMPLLWRFESNGWPRDRLFAINITNPSARALDDVPEAGRSSAAEARDQLAAFVTDVLRKTGAEKVVLVGNSRGANIIRNFLKNAGGAAVTSHAVLGGGVVHGVYDFSWIRPTSEFNGASPFLHDLNGTPGEVVAGVAFLTLRSDFFDKYAQPDGRFVYGFPGFPTGLGYDAPALKGAENRVLPGIDHRQLAMGREAFAAMFPFITGRQPERTDILPETMPALSGIVTGFTAGEPNNVPVDDATLAIFRVDAKTGERQGEARYRAQTAADGAWGPFAAEPDAAYEFELTVPDRPVTHIYRSPFPRGSTVLNLMPVEKVEKPADGALVRMTRPSGYFATSDLLFDGKRPDYSCDRVPNESSVSVTVPFDSGSHVARHGNQSIAARAWPGGHASVIEFTD